ncbi:hypothetical protein C4J81_15430 [Deltaproteobacteria bacterium Smac51]|nr:hypothetical protein C4J81_03435 [Deltaproteobacteria bacterium Smac51]UQZ89547.1 hypothetical protein C4J81_10165 [Deltaproteobacteria bacterium Smac51]UQZ90522.1 hypothetical protein C4J81_15430 [Deltaproteobacteria bacterium Smac51]
MIESVMKFWPVIVVMGSIITTIAAWSAKKQFASHADLTATKSALGARVGEVENKVAALKLESTERFGKLEKEVAVISSRMEAMPTKEDILRLEAAVSAVGASQKGIERNLHLIMRARMEED